MLNNSLDPLGSFLKENNPQLFEKSRQKPLLIKFSANWCGPCRLLQKVIGDLRKENKELLFLEIDVEKHSVKGLSIFSLPTCFLFFQGKVVKGPQVGSMNLSQLEKFIKINT